MRRVEAARGTAEAARTTVSTAASTNASKYSKWAFSVYPSAIPRRSGYAKITLPTGLRVKLTTLSKS